MAKREAKNYAGNSLGSSVQQGSDNNHRIAVMKATKFHALSCACARAIYALAHGWTIKWNTTNAIQISLLYIYYHCG